MELTTRHHEIDLAAARAAAYGLIASGLRYPDTAILHAFTDPARWSCWPEEIEAFDEPAADALVQLRRCASQLGEDGPDTPWSTLEQLQGAYDALFGHTVRGKCPPYEMEYGRSEIIQRASELADVGGFYAAFGLELGGDLGDRADSVCVECEFMSVLCEKEAYGLGVDDDELLSAVRQAQRDFLRDHLGFWLPAFARRVQDAEVHPFYDALAQFTSAFITAECRRAKVSAGPELLELRPADVDAETSIECGDAAVCEPTGGDRITPLTIHGK